MALVVDPQVSRGDEAVRGAEQSVDAGRDSSWISGDVFLLLTFLGRPFAFPVLSSIFSSYTFMSKISPCMSVC